MLNLGSGILAAPARMRGGLLLLLSLLAGAVHAVIPAPPQLDATASLLMDFASGQVLAEAQGEARVEPASLTKMLTVYVVLDEIRRGDIGLDDLVTISEKAWRTEGSRMFVEVDTKVPVKELLTGVIVQSGNDAAVALAEYVAGSEETFAELMNQHAARLGMKGSHFVNATGLPDPDHYTTAHDLARLAAATIRDFPDHYPDYARKSFTFNGITQHNRNRLLWRDKSVDGLKTGHTESAGYCLVASAERQGQRLISVVLGTPSDAVRFRESEKLLNYGFRFFESHKLFAAGEERGRLAVFGGASDSVGVTLPRDVYIAIPRGSYDQVSAAMDLPRQIEAPVAAGLTVGKLRVTLGEETLAEQPLLTMAAVAQGNLWQRAVDQVRLWLQ